MNSVKKMIMKNFHFESEILYEAKNLNIALVYLVN